MFEIQGRIRVKTEMDNRFRIGVAGSDIGSEGVGACAFVDWCMVYRARFMAGKSSGSRMPCTPSGENI